MSRTPRVSIILPTHNGAAFLAKALESCLAQTFTDWELVVIDDASTDKTPEILAACQEPRLRVLRHENNRGLVASLNHGFSEAKGDMLTWTSDDNYYAPTALQVMVSTLDQEPAIGFVYTAYYMVDEAGGVLRSGRTLSPEGLDRDNGVGGCFLYRRKVYEIVGDFDSQAFLAEDYQYWLRVRDRFSMKMIPEPLYYYRLQGQSLTARYGVDKVQEQVARARRPFIPAWRHYFFLAEYRYYNGQRWKGLAWGLVSLVLNPFQKAGWRVLVLTLLSRRFVDKICHRQGQ